MPTQQTVLLLGATGRTGRRVLEQLLARGVNVRAVVRSTRKLPAGVDAEPRLTVLEADLLSLSDPDLLSLVRGCDAVISCLGHVVSIRGILGPPFNLVTQATKRLCRGIEALQPGTPIKFVLMSSVSVNHPRGSDTRRGTVDRVFMWMLRCLLPPANDNQKAAHFLHDEIGTSNPSVQWVAVRPDTLLQGEASEYTLHEGLVSSLFAPGNSNMANVAHFMCDLVTRPKVWDAWNGKLPVVINARV
jgi:nucleoside-diphosphate-sugar epimerase